MVYVLSLPILAQGVNFYYTTSEYRPEGKFLVSSETAAGEEKG
jgi:hypothetical protein